MKFYDRKKEMEQLREICRSKSFRMIVITGRRRIGKTRLVTEFLRDRKYGYIFVPMHKTKETFLQEVSRDGNIPEFRNVIDLFRYLFEMNEYIFIDEFQNFYDMDKSIYSDMQQLVDEFKQREKKCCVFISGSSYSLMNRIFVDSAHPLYGRADLMMELGPLDFATVAEMLSDISTDDPVELIKYYSVFGGIPKYYDLLEGVGAESFEKTAKSFFFDSHMPLLKDEGRNVLVTEFAGEYKIYYSILEAIALGKNKTGEINSVLEGTGSGKAARYLDILRKEYNVVRRETPILDDPRKSRKGIYAIRDPFLHFWFGFIKRYDAYFEQGRTDELFSKFLKNFDTFLGFSFERIVKEFLIENRQTFPFSFERIGRQWGTIKGAPKGSNSYEVDLLLISPDMKKVMLLECKWRDLDIKESNNVLRKLQEKTAYVGLPEDTEVYYGICARKIADRDSLVNQGVLVLDLEDMWKLL
ncbi:ATP-binding protein [uncultured Methanolobus sp.]|uniref:ATP-binding protein n=1 Tax=uncultured Methanolobus sp. TaxID=218300 RepID=UPI002AAAB8BF|nr:ATP-binding protein [uncultured Methanolobus sp.]